MTHDPRTGGRVVWTGRRPDDAPGGLDGWSTDDTDLTTRLRHAVEVLVLDPLSFPWKTLQGHRDLPLVVRLPEGLSADDVDALLGRPLLQHLTRHDRLIDLAPRADEPADPADQAARRADLAVRHDVPDEVWVPPAGVQPAGEESWEAALAAHLRARPDSGPATDDLLTPSEGAVARWQAKEADLQVVAEVVRDLDRTLAEPDESVVEVHGADAPVSALRRASRCVVRRAGAVDGDLFVPSPICSLAWLTDGGQAAAERTGLLRAAVESLGAGGRLVVVGYVVDRPGGPANPAIGRLVEELDESSAGAVHVDEVRSLRLRDEPWARAVLLGATRLGPEEPR